MKIKKRPSGPYRAAASRLKQLLFAGRVIEGSLYRRDRGSAVRHQLSDRATGKFRCIYVPQEFAGAVAEWSENWARAKALLKEMSELARAELVAAITAKTGRRTVAKPARSAAAGKGSAQSARRRSAARAGEPPLPPSGRARADAPAGRPPKSRTKKRR